MQTRYIRGGLEEPKAPGETTALVLAFFDMLPQLKDDVHSTLISSFVSVGFGGGAMAEKVEESANGYFPMHDLALLPMSVLKNSMRHVFYGAVLLRTLSGGRGTPP